MANNLALDQRIQEIFDEVNEISIVDIISNRIDVHNPSATNADALCPFHDDHSIGSFKISKKKNLYKCFSCEASGNGINFVSEFEHISYYQAALKIALEFGIIGEAEFKKLTKGRVSKETLSKVYEKKSVDSGQLAELQDESVLDFVYSIFSQGQILEGEKWKLSAEHMQYLLLRGFKEEEIEELGFFTMPNRKSKKRLYDAIFARGQNLEILEGVPGFFYDTEKEKYDFSYTKGIGIPIKNAKGYITGIQVRRDTVLTGQSRYTWFTSSFADGLVRENQIKGSSAGSPQAVVYPQEQKYPTLFITEGYFKAAKITKQFNSPAVSVQGVGSRKNIVSTVKSLMKKVEKNLTHIYIAFDADMASNFQVLKQTIAMYLELKQSFSDMKILIAHWDEENGKGIDDVIDNGKVDTLGTIQADIFEEKFLEMTKHYATKYECGENEVSKKITSSEVKDGFNKFIKPFVKLSKKQKASQN